MSFEISSLPTHASNTSKPIKASVDTADHNKNGAITSHHENAKRPHNFSTAITSVEATATTVATVLSLWYDFCFISEFYLFE